MRGVENMLGLMKWVRISGLHAREIGVDIPFAAREGGLAGCVMVL